MSDTAFGVFAAIRWPRPFAGLRGVTLADLPREVSAGSRRLGPDARTRALERVSTTLT